MKQINKINIIVMVLLIMLLSGSRLYAIKISEPYQYTIHFEFGSATPELDYILKFETILDTIRSKRPIKIEIEGAASINEMAGLAAKRAEYIERWLKSEKINAGYTVRGLQVSESPSLRSVYERDDRRVTIRVYDQKIIYAMQDAERIKREKEKKKPVAYVAGIVHSFGSVLEGRSVAYEFNIRNAGDADLEIIKVKPG